jgi:purine-binding chemotaxis protein CheW
LVEVLPLPKISRIPHVPAHVLGVMNFRGEVLTAIDLKQFFGLPQLTLESDATIIVVEHYKVRAGLLVDGIGDLVSLSRDDFTEEPVLAERSQPTFFGGTAHWGDILVSIIRLEGFWWLPVELQ